MKAVEIRATALFWMTLGALATCATPLASATLQENVQDKKVCRGAGAESGRKSFTDKNDTMTHHQTYGCVTGSGGC